ncbi:hypothetical protein JTB14_035722 [Gonioctena quinquepunctata]|nr:hypothetical protein JTB14_035722 [Gonioctena quinquepunctata]
MKGNPIFFLALLGVLAIQVESGVIIDKLKSGAEGFVDKIKDGVQDIKCKAHKFGNKIHSHEHQTDPCGYEEDVLSHDRQLSGENEDVTHSQNSSVPNIDIRGSNENNLPKTNRGLSHVKPNLCPGGFVADSHGACREEY